MVTPNLGVSPVPDRIIAGGPLRPTVRTHGMGLLLLITSCLAPTLLGRQTGLLVAGKSPLGLPHTSLPKDVLRHYVTSAIALRRRANSLPHPRG